MTSIDDVLNVITPAGQLLGREVLSFDRERGGATLRFTAREEFLNRHGTVQGGFLAAMLDSVTALALYSVLPPQWTAVTTTLNVSFLRPASRGYVIATGTLLSRNERRAQSHGELCDLEGTVLATAEATLRILPRKTDRDLQGEPS